MELSKEVAFADPRGGRSFLTEGGRRALSSASRWQGTPRSIGARDQATTTLTQGAVQNDITRAGCWAHARRKFKNALDVGLKASIAALRPTRRLFWLERALVARAKEQDWDKGKLLAQRAAVRERRSRTVVAAIYAAADELQRARSMLPKSELGKALTYLMNQRGMLTAFLDDARVLIHNNDAERSLRHVVTGRKNWLVFGSTRGGEVGARLYSLVLSCRANDVNPEAYLKDVLGRISSTRFSQIATLTPWGWKAARAEEALLDSEDAPARAD